MICLLFMVLFFASIFYCLSWNPVAFVGADSHDGEDILKLSLSIFSRNMCELRAACVYNSVYLHLILFHTQDNDMLPDLPRISMPVSWTLPETGKLCFLN